MTMRKRFSIKERFIPVRETVLGNNEFLSRNLGEKMK
jgi:hypothetical protein